MVTFFMGHAPRPLESLAVLPVVSVGALAGAVQGIQGLLGIPMTSILAALPPVLVVVAVTASLHLLTAFLRHRDLERAAS